MSVPTNFEGELEVFRTEEEVAQQYFFAYLSVRSLSASDKNVLANMNANPLFWKTTHHALLLAAFVALGRIFDQDSKSDHNIDKLLRALADGQMAGLFTKASLAQRKMAAGLSAAEATAYAEDAHDLVSDDVRGIRKQVAQWRKIYDARYRDVRHTVFAHKRSDVTVAAALARTDVEEITDLLGFLSGLYSALDQLYLNGRQPIITVRKFDLQSNGGSGARSPGERVFYQGHDVLRMVSVRG